VQAGYRHPRDPFDLHNAGGAQLLAYQIAFPVILLAVVTGALALLFRFHRAAGTERLQLRWVSLAAGLVALVLVLFLASLAAGVPSLPDPGLVGTVCLVILTSGISAATLGYRLYDLDRIISRTLAYGLLTVLLGGGYAAVAVGLSQLASGQSSLTVALEWDGYDDEAAIEGMARLAAEIEPGRATVAQWAEAIRRRGAERRRQPWH
jgi:hypothetical protein